MANKKIRNYKQEYKQSSQSSTKAKKDRAARNLARAKKLRSGSVKKGDGKDVGHKKALKNGGSRSTSNTKVQSQHSNRSHGGRIGSRAGKSVGGKKGMQSRWGSRKS